MLILRRKKMKLFKYRIQITSNVYYEREVIAENEDKAINEFINTLDDNDKTHEENFDVFEIENVGIAEQEDF
jgi:hypothetical protein